MKKCTNNFGTTKGHFYNVEKRFKTIEGLRDAMERKADTMGVNKDDLKKCMKALKPEHNYLWVVTEKGAYVLDDLRLNRNEEVQGKFKALLGFAKWVYSITTWRIDNYRMEELSIDKLVVGIH